MPSALSVKTAPRGRTFRVAGVFAVREPSDDEDANLRSHARDTKQRKHKFAAGICKDSLLDVSSRAILHCDSPFHPEAS